MEGVREFEDCEWVKGCVDVRGGVRGKCRCVREM